MLLWDAEGKSPLSFTDSLVILWLLKNALFHFLSLLDNMEMFRSWGFGLSQ